MTDWDKLYGHQWAIDLLKSAIQFDRIGHAYLITGPRQIGKATLATIFAQALNCQAESREQRPCGQCRPCILIKSGRHPDIRLVKGDMSARGTITLKIDQIRQLQQELNLTASEARYKVAILKQFETANPSAANAFLKTLEEPPGNVILLLTATSADSLLPTIASRCRIIALRPLPFTSIEDALVNHFRIDKSQAMILAHISGGRIGWAIDATRDQSLMSYRKKALHYLISTFERNRVSRFELAERLARNADELPELLRIWISWWRDLTLLVYGQTNFQAITNIDQIEILQNFAANWAKKKIVNSLAGTEEALWQLHHNANTRLVLENLLLAYPYATYEQIIQYP